MKKNIFLSFILLIAFVKTDSAYAQREDINFRQISPPGGFTIKGIYSITQDKLGYIWMATKQGVIRYDSQRTNWFIPSENDSLSLPSEEINDVFSDSRNQLWVATNHGLSFFDRQKQGFKRISYTYEDGTKSINYIISVLELGNNKLLILDARYAGYLDLNKNQFIRIGVDQIKSRPTKIYKDNFNRVWIGTESGEIYQYHPLKNEVERIVSENGAQVTSIYADDDILWVGFDSQGAKMFNQNGELLKCHSFSKTNDLVRVIIKDTYGRLWFGGYEGLFMDDGKQLYSFKLDDYPGLPYRTVTELFEDRQGAIWIGTWSGGVSLIHHSDNHFQTFRHSNLKNSISNNTISSFIQLNKKELLIGTEVGGLNSFNIETKEFSFIQLSNNENIVNIKSLCKDKFGGIWVGTYKKGLWYRPAGHTKFKLFEQGTEDGSHISYSSVYSMCAVDSGVWIGTFGSRINFYDFKTKSIRYCFQNNKEGYLLKNLQTQSMLADSKSNLWIGTFHGLYKIHLPSQKITKIKLNGLFPHYGSNSIYYLNELSSGDIWIGTKNNGIIIYNADTNEFEVFKANGLLNGKDVYGIIEDQDKKLWITSNNGLIVNNPKTNTNWQFVYSDGIQSNSFCPQAIYKDDKKNLYFGGTNGFTRINPSEVKINSKKPFTIINDIVTKSNQTITPVYSKKLDINKITLAPKENTFRINFSADNYLMPEKNKYKYRLVNYYDDWIESQNEGSVLFKSLKAGEYIFEVKACNNDGVWNTSPTRMPIVIEKIWYKTTFALIIYLVCLIGIVYLISRFYFERIKLRQGILREKNKRENEEQIHEMKLRFFTNISHEFRTPLSLISWPLKKLIAAENITDEQRDELTVVKRNSNRLLQLINQLIDIRKMEKGKSNLNVSEIDLVKFIEEMQQSFSSQAKNRDIHFELTSPPSLKIEADVEKLDKVIYNLLSNAYKYTQENGMIKISVNTEIRSHSKSFANQLSFGEIGHNDFVEISVEDSGLGIDSEDLLNVFKRFEQGKRNENIISDKIEGSGIGLSICKEYTLLHHGKIIAQSTIGKGSCFTVILPLKQKAQEIFYDSHHEYKNVMISETSSIKPKIDEKENMKHILVVEDNPDFLTFICKFLRKHYHVDRATNGNEALSILKTRNIDLIVSDVMMPKMDGYEFCSIVKSKVETSHIPVILLTALSSSENLITGLDKGADAYLTKPFDENILLTQIENIFTQRIRLHKNFSKQFISKETVEVGSLDNFFLDRVRAVVEKNIKHENFGIEMLTEELMISRSQLHRKIKSLSGSTTTEFVNLVRIKKAVELIKEENYRFNEVFFQVGFSSQSYFNKCFKAVYNTTPKDYFDNLN